MASSSSGRVPGEAVKERAWQLSLRSDRKRPAFLQVGVGGNKGSGGGEPEPDTEEGPAPPTKKGQ